MEGGNSVSRSSIDELPSWNIKGNEMKRESCVTRSIVDEILS